MRRVEFELAARLSAGVIAQDEGLEFLVRTADGVIARDLFVGSSHEVGVAVMRATLKPLFEALGRNCIEGRVFVDIGANIGTTSVAAVTHFGAGRALSVEPSPDNLKLLRCNAILNDVESKIDVVAAAVTLEPSIVHLELSDTNFGDHRIRVSAEPGREGEELRRTVEVRGIPLAQVLVEQGLQANDLGLIWVDVQGFEAQVLGSAGDLPGVPFVVEYAPYWLKRAGGLDQFHELVRDRFEGVIDLRDAQRYPAHDVAKLAPKYSQVWTDLALLP